MVDQQEETSKIVDLNVGGVSYTTTLETLTKESNSHLGTLHRRTLSSSKGFYWQIFS